MRNLNKLVAFISLFATAILLFVVVCPATPTPTAVIQSRTAAPVVTAAPVALPAIISVMLAAVLVVRFERARGTTPAFERLAVLDRTCVFLC